ncbi:MAG: DUF1559 family PulG-like putative transporter [Thermogutta sp.]
MRVGDFAPASGFPDPESRFQIAELICPSDPRPGVYTALGYAVNCGIEDGTTMPNPIPSGPPQPESAAYGVFFNHDANDVPVAQQIKVRTDRIPDGAHRTILASENLQAVSWLPSETTVPKMKFEVGLCWKPSPGECDHINRCKESAPPRPRPSSNHPGGVNVVFCDAHVDFITDDVDYSVYQHLMTPDSKKAGLSPEK